MPQWSTRWAMLAYRNGPDPTVANSTLLKLVSQDFIQLTSATADFLLTDVEPTVGTYSMDTYWQPRVSFRPPTGDSWIRQVNVSARWIHTITYGTFPPPRGTLRLFVRTSVIATALPGNTLEDALNASTNNVTYSVEFRVGTKWRASSITYTPINFWEDNGPMGTKVSSAFIWASTLSAKVIPKSTAFRVTVETVGAINNFGVVGSTTGSELWQGSGAFFLESTADIIWWYTGSTPADIKRDEANFRLMDMYRSRRDLQNLIRSTIEKFDG